MEATFPDEAVENWQRSLLSWADIDAVGQPDQQVSSEPKVIETIQEVAEGIDQLLSDLSVLEERVYPSLGIPPWGPATTPAIMEAEGERIDDLIDSLEELDERIEEAPPRWKRLFF